jgi:hypothetical protein
MICGTFVLLGALGVVQAQAPRPGLPAPRPVPTHAAPPVAQQQAVPAATPASAPATSAPQDQPSGARPSDGPAVPPVVTFRDGLLTVQALNSNLSSVLTAIRNKTGIEFEGAENVSERVAISLGPAPEGEVLSAILAGSKYDFVAIGRPDSPNIVQRVILTVKNKSGAVAEAQPQPRPANGQEGDADEDTPDETPNAGGDPQDTPVQPPPVPQQQPPQTQAQPKSPEQLLQELQEMQRQKTPPEGQAPSTVPRKMPPQ